MLVISVDGKGIVMRPDALRPTTAKAAADATAKLGARLSKGEKRYRKRMAEVGAVYDLAPLARTPADVLASKHDADIPPPAPKAAGKWVTASVARDAAEVVARAFDEAERRDPDHHRSWVALVDGNNHQIDRINTEAHSRQLKVTIVVDLIHGLDVQALLPLLSIYMGHVQPASTFWYLTASPELMALAAEGLDAGMGEMP